MHIPFLGMYVIRVIRTYVYKIHLTGGEVMTTCGGGIVFCSSSCARVLPTHAANYAAAPTVEPLRCELPAAAINETHALATNALNYLVW